MNSWTTSSSNLPPRGIFGGRVLDDRARREKALHAVADEFGIGYGHPAIDTMKQKKCNFLLSFSEEEIKQHARLILRSFYNLQLPRQSP